jgi:hypothetical protein
MRLTNGMLTGIYGRQPPVTAQCPVCGVRAKIRKNSTLWLHGRTRKQPDGCAGSGQLPKPDTTKRSWSRKQRSRQLPRRLRTVSGGAMESSRRRH